MTQILLYHNGVDIPDVVPMDRAGEEIGYGFDWTNYLQDGEQIIESDWIIDGAAIVLWKGFAPTNRKITSVGLTATAEGDVLATNKITTSQGIDERSFRLKVTQL